MKEYEVLFLIKPNLSDARYTELTEKFQTVLTNNGAEIISLDPWGMKELAQPFDKVNRAYYIYSEFKAKAKALEELHSFFALTEDVMRDLVVLKDSVITHPKKVREEATVEA